MTPRWLAKLKSLFGITLHQTKTLGSNITAVGYIADLTFNNIQAGKVYRATVSGFVSSISGTDPSFEIRGTDDSTLIFGGVDSTVAGTIIDYFTHTSAPFVAPVNGQIRAYKRNLDGTLFSGMKLTIEELPNHTVTTQWT